MIGAWFAMMLGVALAGASPAGIVCESEEVPVLITSSQSRKVYRVKHVTHCYPAADAEHAEIDKAKAACDLMITAYGPDDGRRRCRDLMRRAGLDR